jgi:hypothetical protein
MAFIEAQGGPPPGAGSAIQKCDEHARGYLCITVQNRRAQDQPVLANTDVTVTVGDGDAQDLQTNDDGLVTFAYGSAADFADVDVTVTLRDEDRGWTGTETTTGAAAEDAGADQGAEGTTITQLAVPIGGKFTVRTAITIRIPGYDADQGWPVSWSAHAPALRRWTTPDGAADDVVVNTDFVGSGANPDVMVTGDQELDCVDVHQFGVSPQFVGIVLARSAVRLTIDGVEGKKIAANDEAAHGGVAYHSCEGNQVSLNTERHGADVTIEFFVAFRQMLIVGEGTSYEYAAGLSHKYGDASQEPGFRWVVVTQYDVVDPGAVSQDMTVRGWVDGADIAHFNQRQQLAAELAKNMERRDTQFDATDAAHWQAVLNTYGEFDAVIFNNPHPGYGMHKFLVLGLSQHTGGGNQLADSRALSAGRAVSVYTFGRDGALTRVQLNPLLGTVGAPAGQALVSSRGRQRTFVRTNGAGCLNYQNARDQAIALQFNADDTSAHPLTVNDAFLRHSTGAALPANYGAADEFADNTVTQHYRCRVATIGLQEYLLRCYRRYAPDVMRTGGYLYVHGSTTWADLLTPGFTFGAVDVEGMTNHAQWSAYAETFVWYNTNFTSTTHHPSWYSTWNFNPGEPNIENARVFRWQKP